MKMRRFTRRVMPGVMAAAMLLGFSSFASASTQTAEGASYLLSANKNQVSANSLSLWPIGSGGSQSVPEPSTWAMFGLGGALIGAGLLWRRRRSDVAG